MKTEIDTIDSVLFDHPSGHGMASKIETQLRHDILFLECLWNECNADHEISLINRT